MGSVPQWLSFIRTDGLAVTLIVFSMVVFVMVLRWLGTHFVRPLTRKCIDVADAHIVFLNENTKATQSMTSSVGQVLSNQTAHGEKIDDIHDLLIVKRSVPPHDHPSMPWGDHETK